MRKKSIFGNELAKVTLGLSTRAKACGRRHDPAHVARVSEA